MPYFFHLLDARNARGADSESPFTDFNGTNFFTRRAARRHAASIATDLARSGGKHQGFVVVAIDERASTDRQGSSRMQMR